MRTSLLRIIPFIAALTVLSIPCNSSVLRLPNDQISTARPNATIDVLRDWPPTPYTVVCGNVAVTLREYGQYANQDLRPDIVHAIQIFRTHFLNLRGILPRGPVSLTSSVVNFKVEFHAPSRLTGEELWTALLPLQLYYSDKYGTLREVLSADIGLAISPTLPSATFRITFHAI